MAPIDSKEDETKMAAHGVLQPADPIWDHLRSVQDSTAPAPTTESGASSSSNKEDPTEEKKNKKKQKEMALFIHTSTTVYGEAIDGRRRVLQVKTMAPEKPVVATMVNTLFLLLVQLYHLLYARVTFSYLVY
jgi:hypothetical protein